MFLVGDPYKPLFATVTGRGPPPMCRLFIHLVPRVGGGGPFGNPDAMGIHPTR